MLSTLARRAARAAARLTTTTTNTHTHTLPAVSVHVRAFTAAAASSTPVPPTSDNPSKSPYKHGAHRSDAEELVAQFPITEVEGTVALCDGGGGAMGHPIEYIQLNIVGHEVPECRYCGLRYTMKHHH